MQAAEIKIKEGEGKTETAHEDIGGSRGLWKFVRGGNGQINSEGRGGTEEKQEEHGERKSRPESGNNVFQMIKGDGQWGKQYGMAERDGKTVHAAVPLQESVNEKDAVGIRRKNDTEQKWIRNSEEFRRDGSAEDNGRLQQGGSREETGKPQQGKHRKNSGMDGKGEDGAGSEGKRNSGKIGGKEKITGEDGKVQIEDVILNDKWEQLKQIYSVVHPYEDERQYIAIQPKDFVIMTGDYQHLANNSFLLHGFYNYRHIVLGREEDGNFYLGVPGVYYEREKMVALMFGFEAFECDGGRAEAGKFGYYLRKVKI